MKKIKKTALKKITTKGAPKKTNKTAKTKKIAREAPGGTLLALARDELRERREAKKKTANKLFDHSALTNKFFEPAFGYCVCGHCEGLPP